MLGGNMAYLQKMSKEVDLFLSHAIGSNRIVNLIQRSLIKDHQADDLSDAEAKELAFEVRRFYNEHEVKEYCVAALKDKDLGEELANKFTKGFDVILAKADSGNVGAAVAALPAVLSERCKFHLVMAMTNETLANELVALLDSWYVFLADVAVGGGKDDIPETGAPADYDPNYTAPLNEN